MRIKSIDGDGYLNPVERWRVLALNIVRQAVVDWREATLNLANPATASHEMLTQQREAETFFRSPWFEVISDMDGRTMLRKMKEGML